MRKIYKETTAGTEIIRFTSPCDPILAGVNDKLARPRGFLLANNGAPSADDG